MKEWEAGGGCGDQQSTITARDEAVAAVAGRESAMSASFTATLAHGVEVAEETPLLQ